MEIKLFVIIFLSVYFIYYFSLFPSLSGGDSGELLTEGCHLGIVRK